VLADLNAGVMSSISFQSREIEGTQTSVEMLNRGWSSCRSHVLLIEERDGQRGQFGTCCRQPRYQPDRSGWRAPGVDVALISGRRAEASSFTSRHSWTPSPQHWLLRC
jgi:hypothetical protein